MSKAAWLSRLAAPVLALLALVALAAPAAAQTFTPASNLFWYGGNTRAAMSARHVTGADGVDPFGDVIGIYSRSLGDIWDPAGGGVALLSGNFQLSPTVTVQAAAYSAGNAVGGLITVTGAARTSGGTGLVDAIRLKSAGSSANTLVAYAWSKTPAATCTDKAAFAGSASDNAYALPGFPMSVTLASPGSFDTASYGQLSSFTANYKNQDSTPGTAIYLCLVTVGAVTPASTSDLSIVVGGVRD